MNMLAQKIEKRTNQETPNSTDDKIGARLRTLSLSAIGVATVFSLSAEARDAVDLGDAELASEQALFFWLGESSG